MSQDETPAPTTTTKAKRERSTRYPGVPLPESVDLCKFIESRGLDGLTANDIATALGYKNIKTNTFSARLSAARQFGLLVLKDEGYSLTPLAKSILHPVDPAEMPKLYRQALMEPPLYSELASQFAEKKVPEVTILGNVLYHSYQIIATAKQGAAEAFLDSAKFAGTLSDDHVFHPHGIPSANPPAPPAAAAPAAPVASARPVDRPDDVRIDLRLWGADTGKAIRVRAPEVITPASFDRLLQTLRLHLRIEDAPEPDIDDDPDAGGEPDGEDDGAATAE